MPEPSLIRPDWPAPSRVRAASTLRRGGVSRGAFRSLNLGARAGDDPAAVSANRRLLRRALALPAEPSWLRQAHGNCAVRLLPAGVELAAMNQGRAVAAPGDGAPEADAAWTDRPGVVCAVLTADCLPVLVCDRKGTRIAAVHCGWRGLAAGILESAIGAMGVPGDGVMAWLGPAIGPGHFEVGPEVREALRRDARAPGAAFRPSARDGHWYCDLYAVARHQLAGLGVLEVHGGGLCTHSDPARFYSHRRDGRTGRMATLIWMVSEGD